MFALETASAVLPGVLGVAAAGTAWLRLGRTRRDLAPGETVYLVPRLPGAPSEAYRQPLVTVVAVEYGRVTVRLPAGRELTTSAANLARQPDQPATTCPPTATRRSALDLPAGWEEATLW